jgi:hypothetical protein
MIEFHKFLLKPMVINHVRECAAGGQTSQHSINSVSWWIKKIGVRVYKRIYPIVPKHLRAAKIVYLILPAVTPLVSVR